MPSLIERIHHVELATLAHFDQLCHELQLPYFLMGGSLLGAIRHHGFIPWDDDVDVGLLREDYDRFLAQAPAALANTHYFLQTPASDENYALSYAKILDRNTYIEEKRNVNNARKGIFIDVFPLDRIPTDVTAQREQLGKFQLLNTRILLQLRYHLVDNPLRKLQSPLKPEQLAAVADLKAQREVVMTQYQSDDALLQVKNLASQYAYEKEIYQVSELSDLINVPFEQLTVQVPKNYDDILTRLYGDYRQLPPENQQTEKHLELVIMDNQLFTD